MVVRAVWKEVVLWALEEGGMGYFSMLVGWVELLVVLVLVLVGGLFSCEA